MEARPKTLFCDIDGTLIKHQGDITQQHLITPELLPGVLEFWRAIDRKCYKIILVTGRRESCRVATEAQLSQLGLFWDELLMGLPSGARVLINDLKQAGGENTAIAINVNRNEGLEGHKI